MALQLSIRFRYTKSVPAGGQVLQTIHSTMTLDVLVPVTPGTKSPQFGHWASPSRFIGHHTGGKYYARRMEPTAEEKWASSDSGAGVAAGNPVCFFFDSQWDDPFMVLYGFDPMSPRGPGKGFTRMNLNRPQLHVEDTIAWELWGDMTNRRMARWKAGQHYVPTMGMPSGPAPEPDEYE